MGLEPKEIAITLLLVSVLFHYFSYSFTVVAYDYTSYDISLDIIDLYASGIMIGEFDEHNITYDSGVWTDFTLNSSDIRGRWQDWPFSGAGIIWQQRADFFGIETWIDFHFLNVYDERNIRNETIIARWDSDHNWTVFNAKTGYVLFITDPLQQGNITRAVMEDGNLTLTLAQDIAWSDEPNLTTFVSWYIGIVTGAESWGLPPQFAILVRLMTMLGIFSGIFLLSELRRIVL